METVLKPSVDILEGRLNNLNILDDASKKADKVEENKSWKSKENVDELKKKFKELIERAKQEAHNGDLEESLKLFKKAYKINKSEKVAQRIAKLKGKLAELDCEDTEEDEGYVKVTKGFQVPDKIYNKLYPYQKEGVLWFWQLYEGKKGGILGDDMGLGKTIQVISFLSGMFAGGHIKTALIIMPVSLLANWEKEFKKWAPEIRVRHFHGSSVKQRSQDLIKIQSRNGVCLTTYGLANTCASQFSQDKYGHSFIWDYIILDEGHKIKNTANKTAIAIRAIPAKNHFILTGTPIQNNLREMWALFDFVCQGKLLGTSRSFKQEYENPIVRARERDASAYEKRMGQEMSAHLRELIAPHFLRRTKDILEQTKKTATGDDGDGQDDCDGSSDKENQDSNGTKTAKLTRKNDFIIWLYLSQTQLQIYEDFVKLDRVKEILMTTKSPLAELNVLKKICDHPRLLSTMACQQLGLNEELDEEDTDSNYQWCAPPAEQLVQESGKLVFLLQLLQKLKSEGHRTLVFSQSRKMLDIIEKVLKDKGIKMIRIDGTITSIVERESRIDAFQSDPSYSVFLLTTQVGGVGLTLTAADRVVIFDPSWNPATDAQAVDRAYRIGQKNTVVIYRLITCGSLEEKIYRKQVFKQAITKQTTGSSNNPFRYFTRHELRELFVLDDPRSSKTQIQLEKMHSAHRVSDTALDEHIAFLYSSDIFGISDHDLLFTKEAVATQEELSAASEMNDVIQAKVRRAADIMRAESSQANGMRNFSLSTPATNRLKNQTKIQDHVEVFKPSQEDSKRFKPKKVKSPLGPDIIDLTVLDARVDDDVLEQQFSAITLNENRANSPVDVCPPSNVKDMEGFVNPGDGQNSRDLSQMQGNNQDDLVESKENTSEGFIEAQETARHDVTEQDFDFKETRNIHQINDGSPDRTETLGKIKQLNFENDEPGIDDVKKTYIVDSEIEETGMNEYSAANIQQSDSENDEPGMDDVKKFDIVNSETEETGINEYLAANIQQSDSENDEPSMDDVKKFDIVDSEMEETGINEYSVANIQQSDSANDKPGINNKKEVDEKPDTNEFLGNIQQSDYESDEEEISRKRPGRFAGRIVDSESSENEDSSGSSPSNTEYKPTRLALDGNFDGDSKENKSISANIANVESKSYSRNGERSSSSDVLEINSDSENEEIVKKCQPGASDVAELKRVSDSEMKKNSKKSRAISLTDENVSKTSKSTRKFSDLNSGSEEFSYNDESGLSNEIMSSDSENTEENSKSGKDSWMTENEERLEQESPPSENISSNNIEIRSPNRRSQNDSDSDNEEYSENGEDDTESDEECDDESSKTSHHQTPDRDNKSTTPEDSTGSDSKSEIGQGSTKDENSGNCDEVSSPEQSCKYTSCCPKGVHVSQLFNIQRCPCLMSSADVEAYKMHVNAARRLEKEAEIRRALKHYALAYKLCDNDGRLRAKIINCSKLIKR